MVYYNHHTIWGVTSPIYPKQPEFFMLFSLIIYSKPSTKITRVNQSWLKLSNQKATIPIMSSIVVCVVSLLPGAFGSENINIQKVKSIYYKSQVTNNELFLVIYFNSMMFYASCRSPQNTSLHSPQNAPLQLAQCPQDSGTSTTHVLLAAKHGIFKCSLRRWHLMALLVDVDSAQLKKYAPQNGFIFPKGENKRYVSCHHLAY